MSPPEDLSPREAVERYIAKRRTDRTDRTIRSYRNRLGTFVDWCEAEGIEQLSALTPWIVDEFGMWLRQRDVSASTVKGRLSTVRVFLRYYEDLGVVEEGLADSVDVPTLSKAEESSDIRLATADADALLAFYRDSPQYRGHPWHAWLELAWHTGARMGSLHALDLEDYHPDEGYVEFVHRPDQGTPLKNKGEGERLVTISEPVVEALDLYIARERGGGRVEFGREALFATNQGRASLPTHRYWSYLGTQPCLHSACPHGRRRATCEYTERDHVSKCPSTRSPHQVRTGSITWQLNSGLDYETVAQRVNSKPATIRRYYDVATKEEEFENRRREAEQQLHIGTEETQHE
jgi:site-specific recombinase XerD